LKDYGHKSYVPGVKKTLDYEKISIPMALTNSAKRFPNHTAMNYMGKKITYSDLDKLVNRCSRAFMDLGVGRAIRWQSSCPIFPRRLLRILPQ